MYRKIQFVSAMTYNQAEDIRIVCGILPFLSKNDEKLYVHNMSPLCIMDVISHIASDHVRVYVCDAKAFSSRCFC